MDTKPLSEILLAVMAKATAQNPVDTERFCGQGTREQIETTLLDLYHAHKVACCKITTRGVERVVWWPVGYQPREYDISFGRRYKEQEV